MARSISDVWERNYEENTLPKRVYVAAIGFWLIYGLILAAMLSGVSREWPESIWLILGLFVVAIVGIIINVASNNWFVSAIGYTIVAGSLGLMIGPSNSHYSDASLLRIAAITAGCTGAMTLIAIMIPQSLENWGSFLLAALTLLIVGNVGRIFLVAYGLGDSLSILDWVGVFLFMAYITYDWNRAMRISYTMDNAVDVACALYLDVINLFLSLRNTSDD
jgi:FtsH-binding integral membrane protein